MTYNIHTCSRKSALDRALGHTKAIEDGYCELMSDIFFNNEEIIANDKQEHYWAQQQITILHVFVRHSITVARFKKYNTIPYTKACHDIFTYAGELPCISLQLCSAPLTPQHLKRALSSVASKLKTNKLTRHVTKLLRCLWPCKLTGRRQRRSLTIYMHRC